VVGSVEVGVVEVAEPCWLLDAEPLAVWPVWVEPVTVDAELPVVDVVVDVFAEPTVAVVPLTVGLPGLAPPGLTTVEIPRVARGLTSTVTVVIVVDVDDAVWVAEGVERVFSDPCGTPESCEWVGGVITGVEAAGAASLEFAAAAGPSCVTGAGGGA